MVEDNIYRMKSAAIQDKRTKNEDITPRFNWRYLSTMVMMMLEQFGDNPRRQEMLQPIGLVVVLVRHGLRGIQECRQDHDADNCQDSQGREGEMHLWRLLLVGVLCLRADEFMNLYCWMLTLYNRVIEIYLESLPGLLNIFSGCYSN